uniref:HNH endonuclease n=1 Tax=Meloidogyne hapla TaxID=6305 RepID=A0A1I8AZP8_MELHA
MDCCCKNTCDPKCREKDPNDKDWESRRKRLKEQLGFDNKNIKSHYDKLDDHSLWRDDDRWDRNNPNLPRENDRN